MSRMLLAGMLALPLLLATVSPAGAQGPGCNTPGGCGAPGANFGYGYAQPGNGGYKCLFHGLALGSPPAGAYSFGFRYLSLIHQHGPLVNYGPYQGYYPFEPYGPWTADLRYTGPTVGINPHAGATGVSGRIHIGELSGGGFHHHGIHTSPCGSCSSGHTWGTYSLATLKNVGHRVHPFHHSGCSNCQTAIQPAEPIQAVSLSVTER